MSEVNIIAILSPAPGKVDRVRELLSNLAEEVHKNEDYTVRYLLTQQIGVETPDIIMIETYKHQEGQKQHSQTPYFKEMFATLQKEQCLAKAPYLATTVNKGGFDLDHKLLGKL